MPTAQTYDTVIQQAGGRPSAGAPTARRGRGAAPHSGRTRRRAAVRRHEGRGPDGPAGKARAAPCHAPHPRRANGAPAGPDGQPERPQPPPNPPDRAAKRHAQAQAARKSAAAPCLTAPQARRPPPWSEAPPGPQGPARKGPIVVHCITGGQEARRGGRGRVTGEGDGRRPVLRTCRQGPRRNGASRPQGPGPPRAVPNGAPTWPLAAPQSGGRSGGTGQGCAHRAHPTNRPDGQNEPRPCRTAV